MTIATPEASPVTGWSGGRVRLPAMITPRVAQAGPPLAHWAVSTFLICATSILLLVFEARTRHWFIIPVTLCGLLITPDAIRWFSRRTDIFEPRAMVGLLAVHLFYLAPILNVVLDHWPRYIPGSPDWRHALGMMALVNVVGLVLYRAVLACPDRERPATVRSREFDPTAFVTLGAVAASIGIAAFAYEIWMFGGLANFLSVMAESRTELAGLGWLLVIAESFPLMLFAVVAVRWRDQLRRRPGILIPMFLFLTATQFLVGGIRGSRTNTMWPIFIALILVHLLVTRITRRTLATVLVSFGIFAYLYGLYKTAGLEVFEIVRGGTTVREVSAETGRDLPTLLLGDLARADIQALVLDRQLRGQGELALGATYLGDVSFLVPDRLLPDPPPDKVEFGTDLLLGKGAHQAGAKSTVVYGLGGEAVMNFGAIGGMASFLVFGALVRYLRRYYECAASGARLAPKLLAPMLCVIGFLVPSGDLDNYAWFVIKFAVPFLAVVWLAQGLRMPRRAAVTAVPR